MKFWMIAALLTIALAGCGSDDSSSSSKVSNLTNSAPAAATPKPISRAEQKREFLKTVDESISGAMIEGNKLKYVGRNVDLHCSVASIVDENGFNATCGEDDDGMPVNIVVLYAFTRSLDKGQDVRIIGTVEQPVEGTNAMGGDETWPTVKAEFME